MIPEQWSPRFSLHFWAPIPKTAMALNTLNPTQWGSYPHKAKASAENDDYGRVTHLQSQLPGLNTTDVDFVSHLRAKIRVHCINADAPRSHCGCEIGLYFINVNIVNKVIWRLSLLLKHCVYDSISWILFFLLFLCLSAWKLNVTLHHEFQ